LILLPGAGAKEAAGMAERLRLKTEARRLSGALEITVSAGVAQWPAGGADVEKVFQAADAALYAAKQQGRNRVVIHAA